MNHDTGKETVGNSGGAVRGTGRHSSGAWICVALAVAVAGVWYAREAGRKPGAGSSAGGETPAAEAAPQGQPLPRLVDFGAGRCQACRRMKPVLAALGEDYAGIFVTEFIDVGDRPGEAERTAVKLIPTQIFYDSAGRELFRHEGFYGKDEILAKWKELGVSL
jgi:thioredoxin 1